MEVAARERTLNVAKLKRFAAQPERLFRRGGRVYLRAPQPRDEHEFFELRRSSLEFLAPFEVRPPRGIDPIGPQVFRAFLDQGPGKGRERWLICSARSGAILGAITIGTIRGEPFQSAVLGYWIGAAHARQGYMSEALPLAITRAFKGLGLRRVEADILPGNRASKRLLRSAGFVKEGRAREFAHVAGRWQDHERWALLKGDAKKSQRPQSRK
ncbi:MAG TPA: GNAT family protein [Planctomycetota bacterium]|nr:GNAT family protein [Planctomycetota bacterium]